MSEILVRFLINSSDFSQISNTGQASVVRLMGCGASCERLEAHDRKLRLSKEISPATMPSHMTTPLLSDTESPDESFKEGTREGSREGSLSGRHHLSARRSRRLNSALLSQRLEAVLAEAAQQQEATVEEMASPLSSETESPDVSSCQSQERAREGSREGSLSGGHHLSARRSRRLKSALLSERLNSFQANEENSRSLAAARAEVAEADILGRARLAVQKLSHPVGRSQPLVVPNHGSDLDEAASNDDPVSMTFMNCIPCGVSVQLRVGCRGQRPLEEVTEASIAEQEVEHQQ